MTIGPGKYDEEASMVQKITSATGVILLVIGGDKGEGFSVQATRPVMLALPQMLRNIADELDADVKRILSRGGNADD